MADETEHTTDTASVSSLSTHAPTWQPEDRMRVTSGGVGYGEPPKQETSMAIWRPTSQRRWLLSCRWSLGWLWQDWQPLALWVPPVSPVSEPTSDEEQSFHPTAVPAAR